MNSIFERMYVSKSRHKVFVSYHHDNDQFYRDRFERIFATAHDIIVPWSVQIGEINPLLPTETIRQKIRDEYLRDSTVTVVLVGTQTWQRKHVDWEIGSSIRHTAYNPRSGLLGIILPTYQKPSPSEYDIYTVPPRLQNNVKCGFAKIYEWSEDPVMVSNWIHEAFVRRNQNPPPDNSYPNFAKNHTGDRWFP